MLKNRDVTLRIGKRINEETENGEAIESEPLEEKLRRVVHVLERPAKKLFAAVCIYVVLDTFRQVEIAKANK